MPAWRSILVLAGAFCLAWLFEEINKEARESRGGHNQSLSRCLAMFLSSLFTQFHHFLRHLSIVLLYATPNVPILLELYLLAALRSRGALMKR